MSDTIQDAFLYHNVWLDKDKKIYVNHSYLDHTHHTNTVTIDKTITVTDTMTYQQLADQLSPYVTLTADNGVLKVTSDCYYLSACPGKSRCWLSGSATDYPHPERFGKYWQY